MWRVADISNRASLKIAHVGIRTLLWIYVISGIDRVELINGNGVRYTIIIADISY